MLLVWAVFLQKDRALFRLHPVKQNFFCLLWYHLLLISSIDNELTSKCLKVSTEVGNGKRFIKRLYKNKKETRYYPGFIFPLARSV